MADAIVSRVGQVNQAGDALAIFLKVSTGEVLTAFERSQVMLDKHKMRTIASGKSAQFVTGGYIGSEYHNIGTEILGQKMNHGEVVISIDGMLISHGFIADIDEAMAHYDVRSQYTGKIGFALAQQFDKNVANEVIKGARASANLNDTFGGTQLANDKFKIGGVGSSATVTEQAAALASALFQAAQTIREKDIPETEEIWCLLRPAEYYVLVQNTDLINKLWGGSGSYSDGNILKVAGINIGMSNNIPKFDGTAATYDPAGGTAYVANPDYSLYHGVDANKTIGIVFTKEAVGTVKLLDLSMRVDYDPRRLGYLMVAKYAMGHGVLRPECCIELTLDTLTNTVSTYV